MCCSVQIFADEIIPRQKCAKKLQEHSEYMDKKRMKIRILVYKQDIGKRVVIGRNGHIEQPQ